MRTFYPKVTATLSFILILFFTASSWAFHQPDNTLASAWTAFAQNKRAEAKEAFTKASTQPNTKAEAFLGLALLAWGEENNAVAFDYVTKFYDASSNPFPHLYALWNTSAMFDGYRGKKTAYQLAFLQKLLEDKRLHGTMRAMVYSALGNHYQYGMQGDLAQKAYDKIGSIDNWAVVGSFENTSGSGFKKNWGVLEHPEAAATFKNKVQTDVTWFKPPVERLDKWFDFDQLFDIHNSVMFAQTFVSSPSDQTVYLRAGCSGSLKIWLNDQIVTSESVERNCDLDIYIHSISLKKGYNRLLVQVGESEAGSANFLIRLTDAEANPIAGLSSSTTPQPYTKATATTLTSQPLFAEQFFSQALEKEPNALLYQILLSQTYLRNDKVYEAKKILKKARALAPESSFLSGVMIEAFRRDGNKTDLTKESEFIKSKDPQSYWGLQLQLNEAVEKQDFLEAENLLKKIVELYGSSQYTDFTELNILAKQNKYEQMIQLVDKLYKAYPHLYQAVNLQAIIQRDVNKNNKAALATLKAFVSENYHHTAMEALAKLYYQNGDKAQALELFKNNIKAFPHAIGRYQDLADQYYELTDYNNALIYRKKVLEFAPYEGIYWQRLATVYRDMNQTDQAIAAYQKAIQLDPTLFASHKALRALEKKADLFENFPKTNAEEIFKNAPKAQDYPNDNSIILINQTQRVVYPQGTTEEKDELLVKILTQQGIPVWKEYSVPFYSNSQSYSIEKAEVFKADGNKVKAEVSDNQIVFTGLQAGDAIHVVYRLEDYSSGMLARHFNDRFYFSLGYPILHANYSLLIHNSRSFQHKTMHSNLQPSVKNIDDFKLYTWEQHNQPSMEGEPYTPPLGDIAQLLEVSTMPNWQFVGNWYSDLVSTKANSDVEVQDAIEEIFQNKPKNLSDLQKAKLIYNYIEENINYLSVAFLQSGLVPQKASKTLSTKLGDCKDLSTLFVALCNQVGVKANLVLVSTRDNGNNNMLLPSINFNHCIARLEVQGKTYYIELTDNKNPFGAISYLLNGANILVIPREDTPLQTTLIHLENPQKIANVVVRKTNLSFNIRDLQATTTSIKTGSLASEVRQNNVDLSQEDREKEVTSSLASDFTNVVKVSNLHFVNLDNLSDTVKTSYDYTVKNELNEVANMKIFRLPWSEKVSSFEFIAAEKRVYAFELWRLMGTSYMEEEISLNIPTGKKLIEVPATIHLSSAFADYDLSMTVVQGKLVAKRKLVLKKDLILPEEYTEFRNFFQKVIEADTKQLALN